jgi:hypothetical protein
MAKLILLSGILVSMWLPIMAAKDSQPRRGLRRTVQYIVLYNIFYVFAALVIYPHLK